MEGWTRYETKKGFGLTEAWKFWIDGRLTVNAGLLRAFNTLKYCGAPRRVHSFWFDCLHALQKFSTVCKPLGTSTGSRPLAPLMTEGVDSGSAAFNAQATQNHSNPLRERKEVKRSFFFFFLKK